MSKKKMTIVMLILILILAGTSAVSAQSQWDISVNVPYYLGLKTTDGELGEFSEYAFILPDIKWHYFIGPDIIRVGAGLRIWTLILESAVYPSIAVESKLGPLTLSASVGGGAFLFFGLYNNFSTGSVFIPEISAAIKLGKRMSLGTGAILFMAPELAGIDNFAFIGTAFIRWTI